MKFKMSVQEEPKHSVLSTIVTSILYKLQTPRHLIDKLFLLPRTASQVSLLLTVKAERAGELVNHLSCKCFPIYNTRYASKYVKR